MLKKLVALDLNTIPDEILGKKIRDLDQFGRGHGKRISDALEECEIFTVEQLLKYEGILTRIPNMGPKFVKELEEVLSKLLEYDVMFHE